MEPELPQELSDNDGNTYIRMTNYNQQRNGAATNRITINVTCVDGNDFKVRITQKHAMECNDKSSLQVRSSSMYNEQTYSLQLTDPVLQMRQVADKARNNWHHRISLGTHKVIASQ